MTARLRRHKGMIIIAIIVVLVLFGRLYRDLHPTIVFIAHKKANIWGRYQEQTAAKKSYILKTIQ